MKEFRIGGILRGGSGFMHLDPSQCEITGDPEYPVIYTDKDGRQHRLHKSRVISLGTPNDKPDKALSDAR